LFQQLTGSGQGINLWTTNQLAVAKWYHVAATVQGTNAYFYINGTLDNSGTRSISAPTTTDPVTFGYGGWNDRYPGVLDEVRIYNRALAADEIAGLASLGNGRPRETDGDGLPDYLEDRTGNGAYDAGDLSNWMAFSTDATGMSDGWQFKYFGHIGIDPNADPDGDAVSNYLEYLMGRNPVVSGTFPDTNGVVNLRIYTPLR
jgi:hypothetical protein